VFQTANNTLPHCIQNFAPKKEIEKNNSHNTISVHKTRSKNSNNVSNLLSDFAGVSLPATGGGGGGTGALNGVDGTTSVMSDTMFLGCNTASRSWKQHQCK